MQAALSIRLGTPSDTPFIVEAMERASAGLFAWLLDGAVPGLTPAQLLALAVNEPESCYSYENALIGECDGVPCGALLGFAAEDFVLPEMARQVITQERQDAIAPLLASQAAGSFYVHSLTVLPQFTRQGVAKNLLKAAALLAASQGHESISLHVWADNHPARALYAAEGFALRQDVHLAPWPGLAYAGPMLLLQARTP